jgi:hypothetical protein
MTDAKQGGDGRIRAVVAEWEMAEAVKTVRETPTGMWRCLMAHLSLEL